MKLNVILVLRTINFIKLQGIHFYMIDINVSGNQGVKYQVFVQNLPAQMILPSSGLIYMATY